MFRWEDMLVILAVGLILFGPNKLVDFAKSLGTAFTEFKKAANPEAHLQPAMAHAAPARSRGARSRSTRKVVAKKSSKTKKKRA